MDIRAAAVLWGATAAAIVGTAAICHRRRWGFLLWLATDLVFLARNAQLGEWAQVALWGVYTALACHGWWVWGGGTEGGEEATWPRCESD